MEIEQLVKRQDELQVAMRHARMLDMPRAHAWLDREVWRLRYKIFELRHGRQPESRDEWHMLTDNEDYGYGLDNWLDEADGWTS